MQHPLNQCPMSLIKQESEKYRFDIILAFVGFVICLIAALMEKNEMVFAFWASNS